MGGQTGKKKQKKGNPGVGVDFKKVKHKVGKKLPKAQNETDTSFKARSINLPSQAVKEDKDGLATNFQNLTLKELLAQTSHYSEKMRKHALQGLSDLFSRHPQELTRHIGLVWGRLVERMLDSDEGVRKELQTLLRERVCPLVPAGQLRPFMPTIMAHVSGATTHLSLDVRNDALSLLDILMDYYAAVIANNFLQPCLSHFCDLLSSSHRSRSIRGQSLKALVKVLKALVDFLTRAFPAQQHPQPRDSCLANAPRFTALCQHRCAWPPRQASAATPVNSSSNMAASSMQPAGAAMGSLAGKGIPAKESQTASTQQDVAVRLLGLLVDCWPECNAAQLSINPELEQASALVHVLTAAILLIQHISSVSDTSGDGECAAGTPRQQPAVPPGLVNQLLGCIVPHFPATMPAVKPPAPVLDHMVQYNLRCAQLLVTLIPTPAITPSQAGQEPSGQLHPQQQQGVLQAAGPAPLRLEAGSLPWVDTLVSFLEGVLKSGEVVPTSGGLLSESQSVATSQAGSTSKSKQGVVEGLATGSKAAGGLQKRSAAGTHQSSQVYASVLQGVETAVRSLPAPATARLHAAVDALATSLPSKEPLRASCLQLQYRLLRSWQEGDLELDPAAVASWLSALPKLLWELGDSPQHVATSSTALRMLHDAARYSALPAVSCSAWPPSDASDAAVEPSGHNDQGDHSAMETDLPEPPLTAALQALQPQLVPIFSLQLQQPQQKEQGSKASKRSTAAAGGAAGVMPGPVCKLPQQLQVLAVDMLYHLGILQPPLLSAAVRTIQHQLLSPNVSLRLTEVLLHSARRLPPATAASLLLTLLFSHPKPSTQQVPPNQEQQVSAGEVAVGTQQGQGDQQQQGAQQQQEILQQQRTQWGVCQVVLAMAQQVMPASALMTLLAPHILPRMQSHLLTPVGVAAVTSEDVLSVYCFLRLSVLALEEVQAGQPDAVPLPAAAIQALPHLLCWYSMHQQAATTSTSSTPAGGVGGWSGITATAPAEVLLELSSTSLAVHVSSAAPHQIVPLLQAAVKASSSFRASSSQAAPSAQGATDIGPASQYAGLMVMCQAVLRDSASRRHCVSQAEQVQAAVSQLVCMEGLPSQLSASLIVTAAVQQLKHAVHDLLGA